MVRDQRVERLAPAQGLAAAEGEVDLVAAPRQVAQHRLIHAERAEVPHRHEDLHGVAPQPTRRLMRSRTAARHLARCRRPRSRSFSARWRVLLPAVGGDPLLAFATAPPAAPGRPAPASARRSASLACSRCCSPASFSRAALVAAARLLQFHTGAIGRVLAPPHRPVRQRSDGPHQAPDQRPPQRITSRLRPRLGAERFDRRHEHVGGRHVEPAGRMNALDERRVEVGPRGFAQRRPELAPRARGSCAPPAAARRRPTADRGSGIRLDLALDELRQHQRVDRLAQDRRFQEHAGQQPDDGRRSDTASRSSPPSTASSSGCDP